jgi:hypothetical protein
MVQIIFVALGAGAATALLFASIASGSIISILLFYLAPLPILIAALGWSHWAGLFAAAFAAVGLAAAGLALGFGPFFFATFLIGIGLPAWWLGYLALLARPAAGPTPDKLEWYPVGRLVVWAALLGTLVVAAAILNIGTDEESFRSALRSGFERMLRQARPGSPLDGPAVNDRMLDVLVAAMPPAAASMTTITNLLNLWLAGRVVKVSGRLKRPWPDIPAMRFPAFTPVLLAAAMAGSFVPGLAGIVAIVLTTSLLIAYAALGFAVLHAITRDISGRGVLLALVYALVVVIVWPVLLMALVGLADTALDIRGRVERKRGPPTIHT